MKHISLAALQSAYQLLQPLVAEPQKIPPNTQGPQIREFCHALYRHACELRSDTPKPVPPHAVCQKKQDIDALCKHLKIATKKLQHIYGDVPKLTFTTDHELHTYVQNHFPASSTKHVHIAAPLPETINSLQCINWIASLIYEPQILPHAVAKQIATALAKSIKQLKSLSETSSSPESIETYEILHKKLEEKIAAIAQRSDIDFQHCQSALTSLEVQTKLTQEIFSKYQDKVQTHFI